jgi:predicted esterase
MSVRSVTVTALAFLWVLVVPGCGGDDGTIDTGPGDLGWTDVAGEDPGGSELAGDDHGVEADAAVDQGLGDVATDDGPVPVSQECAALLASSNAKIQSVGTLTVDGLERKFWFSTPFDVETAEGPWAVVFLWHGFAGVAMDQTRFDSAAFDFHGFLSNHVNDDRMPFLLVTPHADGQAFLDWNIVDTVSGDTNPDVRLFDEVLACLDARFGVDPDHIHSLGFSAGGIMTNLLGVTRGDRMASILTWSGAYLANEENETGTYDIFWPEPCPSSGYVQLVFRGGQTDLWQAPGLVADFDTWTQNDIPWLNELGHDVIDCPHTEGHMLPAPLDTIPDYVIDFFRDHPRGVVDSPWAMAMPDCLPVECQHKPRIQLALRPVARLPR